MRSRHQAFIWTNAGILLIGLLGTNFCEILIEIYTSSFNNLKLHLKMLSGKWRPFCLDLNTLRVTPSSLLFVTDSADTHCLVKWFIMHVPTPTLHVFMHGCICVRGCVIIFGLRTQGKGWRLVSCLALYTAGCGCFGIQYVDLQTASITTATRVMVATQIVTI